MTISPSLLLLLFPAFSSSLFAFSEASPVSDAKCLENLQEIKLSIAHLESKLLKVTQNLDVKGRYAEEQEKMIRKMSQEISVLQASFSKLKTSQTEPPRTSDMLRDLEQEVQNLWASSRKNNFDIHVLELKAEDAEAKLRTVSAQAQKMGEIVTEQWIQIQRLEQALHIAEMRNFRAMKTISSRCSFLTFINKLFGQYYEWALHILDSFVYQFKNALTQTKEYHHQLQRFVKRELEKNEFTAPLANKEFVFLTASALITFPVIGAWMLLS